MFFDVTAYAATDTFNPMYSGKLTFATKSVIEVSKTDVVLTKIWCALSGESNNYVNINDPETSIFDASQFFASYNHKGEIVDLYTGEFKSYTKYDIIVESHQVDFTFTLFGKVKSATVVYNGRDYHST